MTFEGRKVLVTGADGFIGSHLVERLTSEGARVRAFCQYNSLGTAGWLDSLPAENLAGVDLFMGDIRDAELVRRAVDGTEIVLHLAALIAIPYSYLAPRSFFETNLQGTLNVLEACRLTAVERLIHTSTSEVYGTPETVPITESHPLRGQSPYSASKIAADKLCEAYAYSYGTRVAILRPFNTYGPRQSTRAVIPTILSQLAAGRQRIELGSLETRRDFTFVTDTVDGFVRMASAPEIEPATTIQLGAGASISIGELFDRCCEALGVQAEAVTVAERLRPPDSEVEQLLSDPSTARAVLGWEARVDLVDGLRRTSEWLRTQPVGSRVGHYAL